MKKQRSLKPDDVRYILQDELQKTGLDQVPKRLDTLDRILEVVDGIAGEIKTYREEQTLIGDKLIGHTKALQNYDERLTKVEKRLRFSPAA